MRIYYKILQNIFLENILLEQIFLERFSKNFQDFKRKCKKSHKMWK